MNELMQELNAMHEAGMLSKKELAKCFSYVEENAGEIDEMLDYSSISDVADTVVALA